MTTELSGTDVGRIADAVHAKIDIDRIAEAVVEKLEANSLGDMKRDIAGLKTDVAGLKTDVASMAEDVAKIPLIEEEIRQINLRLGAIEERS